MRQHCGLTSIRCHFEWRHPPSSFPFSQTHTHTLSSLLPLQMTYCSGTVLQMRLLWPGPFPLDERDAAVEWRGFGWAGGGRRRLRGKADTFLSRIMLLPPLEEKWPCNLPLHIQDGCIFSLFWGGWGSKEKGRGHHLNVTSSIIVKHIQKRDGIW